MYVINIRRVMCNLNLICHNSQRINNLIYKEALFNSKYA